MNTGTSQQGPRNTGTSACWLYSEHSPQSESYMSAEHFHWFVCLVFKLEDHLGTDNEVVKIHFKKKINILHKVFTRIILSSTPITVTWETNLTTKKHSWLFPSVQHIIWSWKHKTFLVHINKYTKFRIVYVCKSFKQGGSNGFRVSAPWTMFHRHQGIFHILSGSSWKQGPCTGNASN